jgi:hypothetical protein
MVAGVAIASVLLYLVIILSRILGGKIEDKKYSDYCAKYTAEHPDQAGMLSREDFIRTRAEANAVIWERKKVSERDAANNEGVLESNAASAVPNDTDSPTQDADANNHSPSDSTVDNDAADSIPSDIQQ